MANCGNPLTGLLPINDLGAGTYLGFQGGLYSGGLNRLPAPHDQAGRIIAADLAADLDAGQPFAFAVIGFSGTNRVWNEFEPLWNAHPHTQKAIKLLNLCLAGTSADDLANLSSPYWTGFVPGALLTAQVPAGAVRVVWVQTSVPPPPTAFPGHAQALQAYLVSALQNIKSFFPNCRIAYLTSGHYHGYANTTGLEPYVYEQAFGVKWVIEQQISGDPVLAFHGPSRVSPWIAWAGYPWTDGDTPRFDGLFMECPADFIADGSHPSTAGSIKCASVLFNDLLDDWTAKTWMLDGPVGGGAGDPIPPTQTGN